MRPVSNGERQERDILWLFDFALILKLIGGSIEVVEGILVLIVPPALVLRALAFVSAGELTEDPHGLFAVLIHSIAHTLAIHAHYLVALYLALHGAIKILLVLGIFAGKRLAYPLFMLGLIVFGSYEAYRGFYRHETLLQIFAVFDLCVLFLTLYEYRRRYPATPPVAAQ